MCSEGSPPYSKGTFAVRSRCLQQQTDYQMDVLAYVRVSTQEQGRSGLGLDAQRVTIKRAAEYHGWNVVDWVEDTASGKSLDRPGIQKAIARLENGGPKVLVAAKLDRIARSALDFLRLVDRAQDAGWSLIVLDVGGEQLDMTTAMGRFTATILASVAELERNMIGDRTKQALAAARDNGTRLGRPPSLPQAVRTRIVEERRLGRSLRTIAHGLNQDGVATAQGGARWWASTVSAVLTAPSR